MDDELWRIGLLTIIVPVLYWQVWRQRSPTAKAPLRGLFYVGCDAGGYGCGTHQAVDSAFKVAHMVIQYHQMHRAA